MGNTVGLSLSRIRNRLIHGVPFNPLQLDILTKALGTSKEHLRCVVERLILAVLNWPVSESKASKEFLSRNRVFHKNWQDDREALSTHWEATDNV